MNRYYPHMPFGVPQGSGAPIAPPLSGGPSPANPIKYCTAHNFVDGSAANLLAITYAAPQACGFEIAAPSYANTFWASNQNFLTDGVPGQENNVLGILGTMLLGIGGVTYKVNFDVPFSQVVQWYGIAESIVVSARLYKLFTNAAPPNLISYNSPPLFQGQTFNNGNGPIPVVVQAIGGQNCGGGLSNLTRRLRLTTGAASFQPTFPPDFATAYRVIGDSANLTTSQLILVPSPVPPFSGNSDVGPIAVACCDTPISDGCFEVKVINAAAGGKDFEIVWRLGFSGCLA